MEAENKIIEQAFEKLSEILTANQLGKIAQLFLSKSSELMSKTRELKETKTILGNLVSLAHPNKGIEPWTFEQKLGEAVFIPAGCPHQVRNLKSCVKVALDFVSPENVEECIRLTEEFRLLPEGHRVNEDKLEVKKIALHALSKAIRDIAVYDRKESTKDYT